MSVIYVFPQIITQNEENVLSRYRSQDHPHASIPGGRTTFVDNAPAALRDNLDHTVRQSTDEFRDLGIEHRDLHPEIIL